MKSLFKPRYAVSLAVILLACCKLVVTVHAQTVEIQVYDAEINDPGHFSVVWHNNYTPKGRTEPDFEGGIVPDRSLNGGTEWAYGLTDWMELGLYFPLYTIRDDGRLLFNGAKLRALLVSPRARERFFFYGLNFEYSYNASQWDAHRSTGEIRPIMGVHAGAVDLIINPVVDTAFNGFRKLGFALATRVAYNFSKEWAAAVEQYSDFGPLERFKPSNEQEQTLFAVIDYNGEPNSVEFGIGRGLNAASDRQVLKLMLIHSF